MKDYKKMSSQELTKRYLDGDRNISIRDIEKKESEEVFQSTLKIWSFNKKSLEPVVLIPVFLYMIFRIEPMIVVALVFGIFMLF